MTAASPFQPGSKVEKAWLLLRAQKWVSNDELYKAGCGFRYANAIAAIGGKDASFVVLKKVLPTQPQLFFYTLIGAKEYHGNAAAEWSLPIVTTRSGRVMGAPCIEYRTPTHVYYVQGESPHDLVVFDSVTSPPP